MGLITDEANETFRDFVVDGVPDSGVNDPAKSGIRALFAEIDTEIQGGLIGYATWAELSGVIPPNGQDGFLAKVYDDAGTHTDPIVGGTVPNEGIYRYHALSPPGWERIANLESEDAATSAAAAAASATAAAAAAASIPLVLGTYTRFDQGQAVVYRNKDPNNLSSFWITADGATHLTSSAGSSSAIYEEGAAGYQYSTDALGHISETNESTGITTQITTTGGNSGLRRGQGSNTIQYVRASIGLYQKSPTDNVEHLIFPSSNLFMGGDSLIKPGGTGLGAALAALYPSRATTNQASATQFSMHMAARLGATTINGVTLKYAVPSGSIPTSGGVTVTPDSTASIVVDLFFSWNFTLGSFFCTLGGVPGIISYDSGTGIQTFTRTNSGTAVSAASPLAIKVTSGFAQNLTGAGAPAMPGVLEQTSALLIGYNDVRAGTVSSGSSGVTGYTSFNLTNTMGNIAQVDALLSSRVKRRIWGLMPQSALPLTAAQCTAIDGTTGGPFGFTGLGVSVNDTITKSFLDDAALLRAALVSTYPYTADFMAAFKSAGHTITWPILGTNYDFIRPDFNSSGSDGTHWTTAPAQALAASVFQAVINANNW